MRVVRCHHTAGLARPKVVLGHLLVAKAVGVPDIPQFFGYGHGQSSHLCECFWRLIGGTGNKIHSRCVNPWHIKFELSTLNQLRSTCTKLSKKYDACGCGAAPACLHFRHELYDEQMRVVEELFTRQPKLKVRLPSYEEFEAEKNAWWPVLGDE